MWLQHLDIFSLNIAREQMRQENVRKSCHFWINTFSLLVGKWKRKLCAMPHSLFLDLIRELFLASLYCGQYMYIQLNIWSNHVLLLSMDIFIFRSFSNQQFIIFVQYQIYIDTLNINYVYPWIYNKHFNGSFIRNAYWRSDAAFTVLTMFI